MVSRIGKDAVFAVHHANAMTGETPFWDEPSGILWSIDIQAQRLIGYAPESGATYERTLPSMPGFVTGRRKGGLLLGLEDGIYPFDPDHGLGDRVIAVEAEDTRTRINDGRADSAGRLWFGTMDKTGAGTPIGSLYRMGTDGIVAKLREAVQIPNSIEFSPDGARMYFADSRTRRIETIAYDPAMGSLGEAKTFVEYPEGTTPDGNCVDIEGGVWIALIGAGRIERRMPDGSLDTIIELPVSRPTMPTLGGRDGRTMFITSQRRFLTAAGLAREPLAGDLLAVRVDVPARAPFLAGI